MVREVFLEEGGRGFTEVGVFLGGFEVFVDVVVDCFYFCWFYVLGLGDGFFEVV